MKCVAQNNYIIQRWCRSSHLMSVFVWLTTQMYDDYKKQIEIATTTTIIMTTFESKRKQAVKSILFAWIRKSKTKYELFIEDLRKTQERVRQRALIQLIDVKIAQFCWMENEQIFKCDWRKIFLNRMNSPASNLCIFLLLLGARMIFKSLPNKGKALCLASPFLQTNKKNFGRNKRRTKPMLMSTKNFTIFSCSYFH